MGSRIVKYKGTQYLFTDVELEKARNKLVKAKRIKIEQEKAMKRLKSDYKRNQVGM